MGVEPALQDVYERQVTCGHVDCISNANNKANEICLVFKG